MKTPKYKDQRYWEMIRGFGKIKFIILHCVLFAIPNFLLLIFIIDPLKTLRPENNYQTAVISTLCGAAYGWFMWIFCEKRYQKYFSTTKEE